MRASYRLFIAQGEIHSIDTHLEALVTAQQEDGGWPIGWLVWTPITELEWRGSATIEALKTLQAYGRLS
jgi:hypothetical protein